MSRRSEPHTPSQLVAAVADRPPTFDPGTAWAYSNTGYVLLGMMIEARSKQTYAHYLRDRLFVRAKLKRTVVGDAHADRNRALGYRREGEIIQPAHPIDLWAAGLVVVAWINNGVIAAERIAEPLLDVIYGGDAPQRSEAPAAPLKDWVVRGVPGTYEAVPASLAAAGQNGIPAAALAGVRTLEAAIEPDGVHIGVKLNGRPKFIVARRGGGALSDREGHNRIRLQRDGEQVVGLVLDRGPVQLEYRRAKTSLKP